jgi:flagellar hook-length control protein FliK
VFLLQATSNDVPVQFGVPARRTDGYFTVDHSGTFEAELKRAIESGDHSGAKHVSSGSDDSASTATAGSGKTRESDEVMTRKERGKPRDDRAVQPDDRAAEAGAASASAAVPAEPKAAFRKSREDAATETSFRKSDTGGVKARPNGTDATLLGRGDGVKGYERSRADGETVGWSAKARVVSDGESARSPKNSELSPVLTGASKHANDRVSAEAGVDRTTTMSDESRPAGVDNRATIRQSGATATGTGSVISALDRPVVGKLPGDQTPSKPGERGAARSSVGRIVVADGDREVRTSATTGENRRRIEAKSAAVDHRVAARDADSARRQHAEAQVVVEKSEFVEGESEEPVIIQETKYSGRGNGVTLEVRSGGPGGSADRLFGQTMNDEIVRQSTILLKSDQRGEIRMVLKPEQLGNLRIRLEIDHNRITGRFVVDNAAVKEAVEQNLESLVRAFREQGYESATLDVTVGGRKEGSADAGGERKEVLDRRAVRELEESTPALKSEYDTTINLVV